MRSTREKNPPNDQTRASQRVRADWNGATQRTRSIAASRGKLRDAVAEETTEEAQVCASSRDMKSNTINQARNINQRRQSKRVRPMRSPPEMPCSRLSSNWSTLALLLAALLSSLLLAACFQFARADSHLREAVPSPTGASHSAGVGLVGPTLSEKRRFERSAARIQTASRARPATGAKPVGGGAHRQQPGGEPADSMAQQQLQTSSAARSIKNVTAQNGQSVLLHCLVEANAQGELPEVSWFRGSSEPQLLTYDTTTIIPDERFLVRQGIARPNDWALQIKALDRAQDAGLYQCQTSGDPPQLQSYQLNIVEPQVDILGAPDLTVRLGAAINLTCVISPSADEPQFVFWYRDERMINYNFSDETRAKIVISKWGGGSGQQRDSFTSNLQIFRSQLADAGNYTCAPSGARSSSIQVHVLQASDKRLMLFQQDQESNPLAAGSHHTTSSAISAHVIRLSRGRTYAFLVGLFIFATWFQLVAQLQTLVSLILLAIIGLLLGQREGQRERRQRKSSDGELALDAKRANYDGKPLQSSGGGAFDLEANKQVETERTIADQDEDDNRRRAKLVDEDSRDQLLRGAEEAISLLRTLSFEQDRSARDDRAQSCSSVEFDDDAFRSLSFGALDRRHPMETPERTQTSRSVKKLEVERPILIGSPDESLNGCKTGGSLPAPKSANSQASPSSSSSSAASTGYNSDSTRPCSSSMGGACQQAALNAASLSFQSARRTPNVSLLVDGDQDDWHRLDELELLPEPEVIELIKGRPTALRLIIEHLQKSGELGLSGTNSMGRNFAHRPRASPNELAHSNGREGDDDDCLPLDLSRAELAKRSASATFQRPD